MKKTFLVLLLSACMATFSSAQCVSQIAMSAPSIQGGGTTVVLSGYGVNVNPGAEYWIEEKTGNGPWTAMVHTTVGACTGWMAVHMIQLSTLSPGTIVKARVKMIDGGALYVSDVVIYRYRRRCAADFPESPLSTVRIVEKISGTNDMSVSGKNGVDVFALEADENQLLITAGDDYVLERITKEEAIIANPSLDAMKVFSTGIDKAIHFKNSDPTLNVRVDIFDLQGRTLDHFFIHGSDVTEVSKESFAPGFYMVRLTSDSGTRTEEVWLQ